MAYEEDEYSPVHRLRRQAYEEEDAWHTKRTSIALSMGLGANGKPHRPMHK
jgi:hypothetical protein